MKRVLIVPAAGRGSRLGGSTPKLMVPVNGRPMVDYILDRYREVVDAVILVIHPDSEQLVTAHLKKRGNAHRDAGRDSDPRPANQQAQSRRSLDHLV
jgi:CTP:molybdopterin cytidylyltransferase MocA